MLDGNGDAGQGAPWPIIQNAGHRPGPDGIALRASMCPYRARKTEVSRAEE